MSRAQVSKHYSRILSQWPVDRLRPELSFQNVLKKRIEAAPTTDKPRNELREINALYSLLENRYASANPLSNSMMHPASAPDHYTTLVKELDELPNRTFFQRIASRFKGMIRLS